MNNQPVRLTCGFCGGKEEHGQGENGPCPSCDDTGLVLVERSALEAAIQESTQTLNSKIRSLRADRDEAREERDDALERLGPCECARDEYFVALNRIADERDLSILDIKDLWRMARLLITHNNVCNCWMCDLLIRTEKWNTYISPTQGI